AILFSSNAAFSAVPSWTGSSIRPEFTRKKPQEHANIAEQFFIYAISAFSAVPSGTCSRSELDLKGTRKKPQEHAEIAEQFFSQRSLRSRRFLLGHVLDQNDLKFTRKKPQEHAEIAE